MQGLGLGQVPGETIQDEALGGIRLAQSLPDNSQDQLVAHELTRIHGGLGLETQLRTRGDRLAKQITRGNLGN